MQTTNTLNSSTSIENHRIRLNKKNQLFRFVWSLVWAVAASWLPRSYGRYWKIILLRTFGAKIDSSARIYSSTKVYYPPFLVMKKNSCLADDVDCYNVAPVILEENAIVSQGAYLCTASHNINLPSHDLITAPIHIQKNAWVCARAYIGMGVTVGEGAVVGATASVYKSVEAWHVVGGNPAKFIKKRVLE